jgi:glycosidase
VLLTLPGTPFIYYGEEVGLQNGPTSADESKRTPMPWTPTGGFTTGTPWFAYAPGVATANVASEINDPQSLLSYYRNWIAARKRSIALLKGDITPLETSSQILAFTRDSGDEHVLVVHNLGDSSASLTLPVTGLPEAILEDSGVSITGSNISLPARSSGVWRIR